MKKTLSRLWNITRLSIMERKLLAFVPGDAVSFIDGRHYRQGTVTDYHATNNGIAYVVTVRTASGSHMDYSKRDYQLWLT